MGDSGRHALHFGLNQLWGLREYGRQSNPSFTGDTVFPRRLGLGYLQLRSSALINATFSATQQLALGVISAKPIQISIRTSAVDSDQYQLAFAPQQTGGGGPGDLGTMGILSESASYLI